MQNFKLGFVGAGHLNSALISGLLSSHFDHHHNHEEEEKLNFSADNILISSKTLSKAQEFASKFGVVLATNNAELVKKSQIIFLGVRPNQLGEVFEDIKNLDLSAKIIICFAAGVKLENYRRFLGEEVILIRAMPNVAVNVSASLTGLFADRELSEELQNCIEELFSQVGSVVWLDDETQIDAITALSGSGIALFFRFMEAMAKEGEGFGFEQDEIYDIVALTALSAATLALEKNEKSDFSAFVKQIATKGGTTEAALNALNGEKLDDLMANALRKAIEKCRDLGDKVAQEL